MFPANIAVIAVIMTRACCPSFVAGGSTHTTDNILDFYPEAKGDGLNIIWAHAVNSQDKLSTALADDTMMLEADISPENGTGIPIMAHPPHLTSDITLAEWINRTTTTRKGMKLDFKYIDILPDSLKIVKLLADQIHQPIWYNADIVHGPNSPKQPIDPDAFISFINEGFSDAVLSLGWTTAWEVDAPTQLYTWTMIYDNLKYSYPGNQPVTFPVRAVWAITSWDKWVWMLGLRDDFSISVWSSASDDVDVQGLVTLRNNGDIARIYYDLPESQMKDFKVAMESAPDVIIDPDTPRWDKTLWRSHESKEYGNYVFLSTNGVGIVGGDRRASVQTKEQYKPITDGAVKISGRVQFVYRPNQDIYGAGDGVELYMRSADVNDGVRFYIGRNGEIRLGSAPVNQTVSVSGELGPSDCYSFEITDKGIDSKIVASVRPVKCSDGTGTVPANTDPVMLSLQLPYDSNQFYIFMTKTGDTIDVLLEDVILPSSSALCASNIITLLVAYLVAFSSQVLVV
ncbi:protein FAM151B-like [Glandiceps talaboti]